MFNIFPQSVLCDANLARVSNPSLLYSLKDEPVPFGQAASFLAFLPQTHDVAWRLLFVCLLLCRLNHVEI